MVHKHQWKNKKRCLNMCLPCKMLMFRTKENPTTANNTDHADHTNNTYHAHHP